MVKNGLFLCSIGFLVILYCFNPANTSYNILNMAIGFMLIGSGAYFFFKGRKNELKKEEGER